MEAFIFIDIVKVCSVSFFCFFFNLWHGIFLDFITIPLCKSWENCKNYHFQNFDSSFPYWTQKLDYRM